MSKSILITRPKYDSATFHLFDWSTVVINEAKQKQLSVYDLAEDKATRSNVESYINKNNPSFIFFNGHGNPNCIFGQNSEILIQSNDNENLTSGAIVYARSCSVGQSLSHRLIFTGTKTFIGYEAEFAFVTSKTPTKNFLDDPISKLFLEPSNNIPISLVKGNSASEAHNKSKKEMMRNIRSMLSSQATKDMRDATPYLYSNYKYQTLQGDPSATIND